MNHMNTDTSNKIELHILATCISPPGTLGGNTRIILECVRRWAAKEDLDMYIYTTKTGYQTFSNYGVHEAAKFVIWPGKVESLIDIYTHISMVWHACYRARAFSPGSPGYG